MTQIRHFAFGFCMMFLLATPSEALPIQPYYAKRYISEFYQPALFRNPDAGGLATYMGLVANDGFDGLITAAAAIGSSQEAKQISLNQSPETIITNYYRILLKRDPDAGGFENYVKSCRPGDCRFMLKSFVQSKEYIRLNIKPSL